MDTLVTSHVRASERAMDERNVEQLLQRLVPVLGGQEFLAVVVETPNLADLVLGRRSAAPAVLEAARQTARRAGSPAPIAVIEETALARFLADLAQAVPRESICRFLFPCGQMTYDGPKAFFLLAGLSLGAKLVTRVDADCTPKRGALPRLWAACRAATAVREGRPIAVPPDGTVAVAPPTAGSAVSGVYVSEHTGGFLAANDETAVRVAGVLSVKSLLAASPGNGVVNCGPAATEDAYALLELLEPLGVPRVGPISGAGLTMRTADLPSPMSQMQQNVMFVDDRVMVTASGCNAVVVPEVQIVQSRHPHGIRARDLIWHAVHYYSSNLPLGLAALAIVRSEQWRDLQSIEQFANGGARDITGQARTELTVLALEMVKLYAEMIADNFGDSVAGTVATGEGDFAELQRLSDVAFPGARWSNAGLMKDVDDLGSPIIRKVRDLVRDLMLSVTPQAREFWHAFRASSARLDLGPNIV